MRYYIGFMPLLAFYALRAYQRMDSGSVGRRVFWVLGVVSLLLALWGASRPWRPMPYAPEPLQMHRTQS
jgi:hypothetical protein